MIPTVFVVTALAVWAAYKIIRLTVENYDLRQRNAWLEKNKNDE